MGRDPRFTDRMHSMRAAFGRVRRCWMASRALCEHLLVRVLVRLAVADHALETAVSGGIGVGAGALTPNVASLPGGPLHRFRRPYRNGSGRCYGAPFPYDNSGTRARPPSAGL